MKKILAFIFIIYCVSAKSQINTNPEKNNTNTPETKSQYKSKGRSVEKLFKRENLMLGGGFNLGLSNQFFAIGLAPEASYFVLPDRISFGMRFNYNFYKDNVYNFNSNIYAIGPFVRGYIWRGLFVQAEYELSSVEIRQFDDSTKFIGTLRGNLNAFLIGGGFHQNFESGLGFYIQILFNTLQTTNFIYPNPNFRTGITYRFNAK